MTKSILRAESLHQASFIGSTSLTICSNVYDSSILIPHLAIDDVLVSQHTAPMFSTGKERIGNVRFSAPLKPE